MCWWRSRTAPEPVSATTASRLRVAGQATRRPARCSEPSPVCTFPASGHGGSLYVASNGLDGGDCGPKKSPCRSISRAIANAAAGDKIIVGPGRYGDLNRNGTLGETGEETPAVGCDCMLSINRPVSVTSSTGTAVTVIDATSSPGATNVLIITNGGELGKPGKGFTVTNTGAASD